MFGVVGVVVESLLLGRLVPEVTIPSPNSGFFFPLPSQFSLML